MPPASQNDVMFLLGEIKADTKAINAHLAQLNSKVATQEKRLDEHDRYTARQEGEVKAVGRFAGAAWGVGSSVLVYAIISFLGIRK